jgi:hypothetical protein
MGVVSNLARRDSSDVPAKFLSVFYRSLVTLRRCAALIEAERSVTRVPRLNVMTQAPSAGETGSVAYAARSTVAVTKTPVRESSLAVLDRSTHLQAHALRVMESRDALVRQTPNALSTQPV